MNDLVILLFVVGLIAAAVAGVALVGGVVLRVAVACYNRMLPGEDEDLELEDNGFSPNVAAPSNARHDGGEDDPNPFAAPATVATSPRRREERLPMPGLYHAAGIVFVRTVAAGVVGMLVVALGKDAFVDQEEMIAMLPWAILLGGLPILFLVSLAMLKSMLRIGYATALRLQLVEIIVALILAAGMALIAWVFILLARLIAA